MSGKPKLFLLDAGPVIGLHELGLWHEVLRRAQVVVPSIVAEQEAEFWDAGDGVGHPIDLHADAKAGHLQIACADTADIIAILARLDHVVQQSVHAGEAEALALLACWDSEKPELCTADGAAVRAACLLGLADRVVSLEVVLRRIGLGPPPLRAKYSDAKVRGWVAKGRQMRIRGEGLAP